MTIKELIHADKISTYTDRKVIDLSLVFGMCCLVSLTALLILKKILNEPVLPLFVALACLAAFVFVFSLLYTTALLLRKRSLKVFLSLLMLTISIILAALVIAV